MKANTPQKYNGNIMQKDKLMICFLPNQSMLVVTSPKLIFEENYYFIRVSLFICFSLIKKLKITQKVSSISLTVSLIIMTERSSFILTKIVLIERKPRQKKI